MKKILIFGNSGSGKSTLAQKLVDEYKLAHLDLDTIAWQAAASAATSPPQRQLLSKSKASIDSFCNTHNEWVIEGCYSDLLELISDRANEAIFMDLSVDQCVENAKSRAWEPHKYSSKEAQGQNLKMLIDWIKDYEKRDDTFSKLAHQTFYEQFDGAKTLISTNQT